MEWIDDPLRPAREQLLADRRKRGEVVGDDGIVALLPENVEVATVYMQCRGQVVSVGMAGVADISIPAVKISMDLLGVQDQKTCLARVQKLFDHFETKRRDHAR